MLWKNEKWAAVYYNKGDIHYLDRKLFCKALPK
jgi:hypothetical protein